MKQFKTINQNKADIEIGYKEQKQHLIYIMKSDEELGLYKEPKQETLYDAFLNCLVNKEFKTKEDYIAFKGAEFGAKWQQERSYSEEDMLKSFMAGIKCESNNGKNFEQFIKEFKKK